MKKTLTILSLVILALLASCADEPVNIGERTSVEIKTGDGVKTRTILPTAPDISTYTVTLDGESEDYTNTFAKDVPITFDNVLVGAYTVKVEAKDSDEVTVATGSVEANITASGSNSITVPLEYLTEGTGRMEVEITWDGRTNGQGPFDEAVKGESLGFQAKNNETGEAYGNLIWADEDDLANKKLTYVAEGLAPSTGTTIYFDIYTKVDGKDQVIARTFYTVVQVISNLTSRPDSNETDNFKITDESIIQYLKNVIKSTVTSQINAEDPERKIDITWNYPKLSNGTFNASLTVSLYRESDDQLMGKESFEYSNETDLKSGRCTFGTEESPLSPTETYYVTFQNRNATGYSQKLRALDGIRTKVKIDNIELTSTINKYYTMGDTIDVVATITPDTATDKRYTISVDKPDGVTIDEEAKTVTFNRAGDYTITVTATDNAKKQASKSTYVKLSTPDAFRAVREDNGIRLYWNNVESATEYVLTKSVDGITLANETITVSDTEDSIMTYLDSEVYAGKEHKYTVIAKNSADEKFNSTSSSEVSVSIQPATISITLPSDIQSVELPEIDFGNNYILSEAEDGNDNYSISLALENAIDGATHYKWVLANSFGNTVIAESDTFSSDVQNIEINANTTGLDMSMTGETPNTLMLVVTVNGKEYSTTGTFYVLSEALEEIEIVQADERAVPKRIVYGEENAIQLQVKFSPEISYVPEVVWENLTPDIIELTEDHTIKALNDGTGKIKVTATATGITNEIEIQSYIPATDLSLELDIRNSTNHEEKVSSNPGIFFITKNGVEVTPGFDTYSPTTLIAHVTPANAGQANEGTSSEVEWSSSAPQIIDVNSDGKLIFNENQQSGTVTITATIDDISKSQTLHIYDMDIQMREGDEAYYTVTGTTQDTRAIGKSPSFDLKLIYSSSTQGNYQNNNLNNLNTIWCFNNDESSQQVGRYVWPIEYYVTLSNPSKTETEFLVDMDRDMSTADAPLVTAIVKYGDQKVCTASFTADA